MIKVLIKHSNKIAYHYLLLLAVLLFLDSCALVKKNRVTKNRGIEKSDFDLPIIEYAAKKETSKTLIIFLSGDGGWIDFDDELALSFATSGFNTVGFNSRAYFWQKRTPKETSNDIDFIIESYIRRFKSKNVILCGYSFGADVVPFIFSNLTAKNRIKVKSLILLSPFASTDFVVHTTDLLNLGGDERTFKVKEEVEKLKLPIYCYYGKEETPKPLSSVNQKGFFLRTLEGNHRYESSASNIIVKNLLKRDSIINNPPLVKKKTN